MKTTMSAFVVLLAIFVFCFPLNGQVATRQTDATEGLSAPLVTAQAAADLIRFTALTVGSRMRLEILSQSGDTMFDSDFRPGNLIEWPLADQHASKLPNGVYGCILTVEELSGRVTYRRGLFRLSDGKAVFDSPVPARAEAASGDTEAESLSILEAADRFPFTFVGHDGTDARIESTAGGLMFHAGRFYSGEADQPPHMRLTLDGNLGIGVREPQAKLDVAGMIRASEGFQFPDGTILRMEDGLPVLVSDSLTGTGGNSPNPAGERGARTTRVLAAGGGIGPLFTGAGTPGRVLGAETGAPSYNTFYGWSAGLSTTGYYNAIFGGLAGSSASSGEQNAFFGYRAGASNTANYNSFFGSRAGYSNTTGEGNSFFGDNAGILTTTGGANSFFGLNAGYHNTTGVQNSFFGSSSGTSNTTGNYNCFFGDGSGSSNTIGYANVFMGQDAGVSNTEGHWNTFLGDSAGQENITGFQNTFVGRYAGVSNTAGASNTILGNSAGPSNTVENNNTLVGAESDGAVGITNATAIGYQAKVTQSNSMVLGSINGVNNATADTRVGIGTTTPDRKLQIASSPGMNAELHIGGAGDEAKDVFSGMGVDLSTGPSFNFGYSGFSFGRSSGFFNVRPDASAVAPNPSLRFMTVNQQRMIITNLGNVGIGTTSPTEKLHVAGNLRVTGSILYGAAEVEVPDYVFEPEYKLMPMPELEKFLASEKHLPNVPSASEIKEKGLSLSDFQMKLLEKIEELTLYTVQQAKTIEAQQAKNDVLEARLATIEQMLVRQKDQREK